MCLGADTLACTSAVCVAFSEFDARPVDSEVQTQPLLQEPRTVTAHYAAGEAEEGDGKVSSTQQQQQHMPKSATRVVQCSS
jgi:hypothetical protein